jgi:hypothetical protein
MSSKQKVWFYKLTILAIIGSLIFSMIKRFYTQADHSHGSVRVVAMVNNSVANVKVPKVPVQPTTVNTKVVYVGILKIHMYKHNTVTVKEDGADKSGGAAIGALVGGALTGGLGGAAIGAAVGADGKSEKIRRDIIDIDTDELQGCSVDVSLPDSDKLLNFTFVRGSYTECEINRCALFKNGDSLSLRVWSANSYFLEGSCGNRPLIPAKHQN